MSENAAPKTDYTGLKRYQGMIISIGIFVVLLAGLLIYASNISSEIEEDSIQSYVAAEMGNSYGELLENVQLLMLNTRQRIARRFFAFAAGYRCRRRLSFP